MLDGRSVDKRAPTSFVGSHSADDGISRRAQCQIELYIYMCEQDLQRQRGNGRSVYIATMYTWKFVFCCFSPAGWRAERQRATKCGNPTRAADLHAVPTTINTTTTTASTTKKWR